MATTNDSGMVGGDLMGSIVAQAFSGIGGHQSARSGTNEWLTPPAILNALGGWESFDLDPCAPAHQPWPTARRRFTVSDNGLIQRWGGRVWLNPPYSTDLIGAFMGRMAGHGIGTALIFARTETDHFCRFVWDSAAALLFVKGRLNFHHADGRRSLKNSGAPSVLCAYGHRDAEILASCGIAGKFVPLTLPRLVAVAWLVSWRQAVIDVMARRGVVALDDLYRAFANHPKAAGRAHYKEKIRQVLQQGPFRRVAPGQWEFVQ